MTERGLEISIAARLCSAGISKSEVVAAFRRCRRNSTSFIDELYVSDSVDTVLLTRCLAEEAGLNFENIPPRDLHIIAPTGSDFAGLRRIYHVVAVTADLAVKIYTVPTLSNIAQIRKNRIDTGAGRQCEGIISPSYLTELLLSKHSGHLVHNAANMFGDGARRSARTIVNGHQGLIFGVIATGCLFVAMTVPDILWSLLHGLLALIFTSCIIPRLLAARHCRNEAVKMPPSRAGGLPIYTVMVALYKEAEVVPQLVKAMKELDWPRSRLEVLFLCEADDLATHEAFKRELLPACFRVVSVPGSGPRTKPKALNFGIQIASGELAVIYDAEDRPHPGQLREAWQRFAAASGRLACLQAPLVITNGCDSWIARQFAFEYAAHFKGLLPWLAKGRFVIPLGGSSNHFRRECLLKVGGWDPFNVTEDAELGSRLARHGYDTEMLSLPTVEDAPNEAGVWLKQRTRWLKGWMQTWLVEMRQPGEMLKQAGWKRFLVYHIMTAGLLGSALLFPFMLFFIAYALINVLFAENSGFKAIILILDIMNVITGFLAFHLLGRVALKKDHVSGPILTGLPFYWLLISVAAWRALWQLYAAPFLWEKTPHRPTRSAVSFK
jgi:cellulose synthase/poly-beta-1,6-N-acetylglucosamine synthase-like glycosyltransferase